MLDFEPCSLELLKRLAPEFSRLSTLCSDLTMGTIWMWRQEQEPQICVRNNTMVLRQIVNGYPAFTYPIGPDADGMLDALTEQVRGENIALRFFAMDEEALQRLLQDPRFPQTMWGYEVRWSDYLYPFEPYLDMSRSDLRKIRYRVSHFIRLYGEPDIRPLQPEDMPAALKLLEDYIAEHRDMDKLEEMELRHSRDLLNVSHTLDMPAAGLWIQGKLAAVCIGEVVGQTLMIHVEKALTAYTDIYPVLLRGFLRYVMDLGHGPLRWFNWEDDSGDSGIRRAKMLYHPYRQVHKYQAHVRAPGAKVAQYPVLHAENAVLTAFRETDKETYYRLNTDRKNNQWWGYDYEEDFTLPRQPSPETFYRSVQYDMSIGDSMNFAVREREDGPMIGETLLWNFTDAGSAELGFRLLPEYQGKGIGKAGAVLLIRYAEEELGLRTRARCMKDNQIAFYWAKASGFRERKRDDTWIYLDRE